jgi:predicted nuclease with TOPRIM domain
MILQHCSRASCVQIIESLREQVAALTKERDDLQDKCNNFQNKCRATLAENAQLREALETISDEENWGEDGCWESSSYPDEIAMEALSTPTDTAALDARLKEEANKWADMAMAHGCTYMVTKIRSMK